MKQRRVILMKPYQNDSLIIWRLDIDENKEENSSYYFKYTHWYMASNGHCRLYTL